MPRKQTPITKSARNEQCQVMIYGVCNHDPETVVLAHLNGGGGGMKNPDFQGAYACSNCHFWLDGGYVNTSTRDERDLFHLQAVIKTQKILLEKGLIKITGEDDV